MYIKIVFRILNKDALFTVYTDSFTAMLESNMDTQLINLKSLI